MCHLCLNQGVIFLVLLLTHLPYGMKIIDQDFGIPFCLLIDLLFLG